MNRLISVTHIESKQAPPYNYINHINNHGYNGYKKQLNVVNERSERLITDTLVINIHVAGAVI